jgi:polyisoprenyl-phosphate glycosyltransferase
MLITLVVPVYNEHTLLPELTRRIAAVVNTQTEYEWEVLYINDGSSDGSEKVLKELCEQFSWLNVLHFSRNFGHQIAISAGMDAACGDAVILMDGDLQDPPELIPGMLKLWRQGSEVVYGTRKERHGESFFKKWTASLYYRSLKHMSERPIPLDTGDFRLMDRRVVDALCQMREKNRFIRGMVSWVGFKQTPIVYERDGRFAGHSKFTLFKMTHFAMDGLLSFSKVPLQWITTLGFLISTTSFLLALSLLGLKLATHINVQAGWTSIMVCILFLGGIQLICVGMLGEYIGRIFDEVRQRPLYVVQSREGQAIKGQHQAQKLSSKDESLAYMTTPKSKAPVLQSQSQERTTHVQS